jgi:hypothetical protein
MTSDPYVYLGTTVLKNIPEICDQTTMDRFEASRVAQRSLELIEQPLSGFFDVDHCSESIVIFSKTSTNGRDAFER